MQNAQAFEVPIAISIAGSISLKAMGEMQARLCDRVRGGGEEEGAHFTLLRNLFGPGQSLGPSVK